MTAAVGEPRLGFQLLIGCVFVNVVLVNLKNSPEVNDSFVPK